MECSICAEPYDLSTRQALSLTCGHSLCQPCFQSLPNQLCPVCCQPLYSQTAQITLNPAVQSALIGHEVYCPTHLIPVSEFCLAHMRVICTECGNREHKSACNVKNVNNDTVEIWNAVLGEIDRMRGTLQASKWTPEVTKSLATHRNSSLTVNFQLLSTLYDLSSSTNPAPHTSSQAPSPLHSQLPKPGLAPAALLPFSTSAYPAKPAPVSFPLPYPVPEPPNQQFAPLAMPEMYEKDFGCNCCSSMYQSQPVKMPLPTNNQHKSKSCCSTS